MFVVGKPVPPTFNVKAPAVASLTLQPVSVTLRVYTSTPADEASLNVGWYVAPTAFGINIPFLYHW